MVAATVVLPATVVVPPVTVAKAAVEGMDPAVAAKAERQAVKAPAALPVRNPQVSLCLAPPSA